MKKLLYLLSALALGVTSLAPAMPQARQHKAVSPVTMQTIRAYLSLDTATASIQDLAQKQHAALAATRQLPNRLRAKYEAEIAFKKNLITSTEYIPLAAVTGQPDMHAKTADGNTHTYATLNNLLGSLRTKNNELAAQLKLNKQRLQQISFAHIASDYQHAEKAIRSFGRVYGNTSEYTTLLQELNNRIMPALAQNALIFVGQELKTAQADSAQKISPLQKLQTTIRPHAIERIKNSGVLALAPMIQKYAATERSAAFHQARTQAIKVDELLHHMTNKLETIMKQSDAQETNLQYAVLHQAYGATAHEFVHTIAQPLGLLDASVQKKQFINDDQVLDEEDQDEGNETKVAESMFSRRDLWGIGGALGLILLYEFGVAPKIGTKKLGVADFCCAIYNRQNPFTTKAADNAPHVHGNATAPVPAQPSWWKRFGFDLLCGLFGL